MSKKKGMCEVYRHVVIRKNPGDFFSLWTVPTYYSPNVRTQTDDMVELTTAIRNWKQEFSLAGNGTILTTFGSRKQVATIRCTSHVELTT